MVSEKTGEPIRKILKDSAVAFFGRFAAYENINLDEKEAYDDEAKKKTRPADSNKPLKAKFRGLSELGGPFE